MYLKNFKLCKIFNHSHMTAVDYNILEFFSKFQPNLFSTVWENQRKILMCGCCHVTSVVLLRKLNILFIKMGIIQRG